MTKSFQDFKKEYLEELGSEAKEEYNKALKLQKNSKKKNKNKLRKLRKWKKRKNFLYIL